MSKYDSLETNQRAIDIIYEYMDSEEKDNLPFDPKRMLKRLRNNGIVMVSVGDGQKDYE